MMYKRRNQYFRTRYTHLDFSNFPAKTRQSRKSDSSSSSTCSDPGVVDDGDSDSDDSSVHDNSVHDAAAAAAADDDDDDAWSDDDDEERKTGVPAFVFESHEQVVMSEIEELVDHVDEILGEIEEEVLQRDRLIQRQKQIINQTVSCREKEDPSNERVGLDATNPVNPAQLIRQPDPAEPSSFERSPVCDLLKLATRDLTEIKSATERARECLFTQMTERADLSAMVAMKEQQIQELAREKGELLRRLMSGNQHLRVSLGEAAATSCSAENEVGQSGDADKTIFYLTEKVMRLERRLQCFQTSHRDSELLSHARQLERHLAKLSEERTTALKSASDAKLDGLNSKLAELRTKLFCFENHCNDQSAEKVKREIDKLKLDRERLIKDIATESKARDHLQESGVGGQAAAQILFSTMSSEQLIQWHLNHVEEVGSRFHSTSSQLTFSPDDDDDDDGISFRCPEMNEQDEDIFDS